jgi:aminopeptidase N
VNPQDREAMSDAAADSLLDLARAAAVGSDSQLQFLKAFAAHARTDAQLDVVEAILTGTGVPEGVTVDSDLRWELLTSLVAGGRYGSGQIDAELETDSTATGQLAAAQARAAIPTAEAKAEAWDAIVERADLPNAAQRSAILGFSRVHDTALLAPYAGKYFESIRGVWESRTYEIAQQIVVGLYPSRLVSQDTLDRTDAFLADLGDDIPSLRRLILENRDGVQRALRAQAVDR